MLPNDMHFIHPFEPQQCCGSAPAGRKQLHRIARSNRPAERLQVSQITNDANGRSPPTTSSCGARLNDCQTFLSTACKHGALAATEQ